MDCQVIWQCLPGYTYGVIAVYLALGLIERYRKSIPKPMTITRFFLLFLLLYPPLTIAETFASVGSYLSHLSGGHEIVTSQTTEIATSSGKRIFGVVCWRIKAQKDEIWDQALGSVFVLEDESGEGLRERVHSEPSDFGILIQSPSELGIEVGSPSRFTVQLILQSPLGTVNYRFIERDHSWYLAGLDSDISSSSLQEGDEALGDTRSERSTNFLTGKMIAKTYSRNKLVTTQQKIMKFQKFSLSDFKIDDERYLDAR